MDSSKILAECKGVSVLGHFQASKLNMYYWGLKNLKQNSHSVKKVVDLESVQENIKDEYILWFIFLKTRQIIL